MTDGDAPQLLDRGDVAMGGKPRETVRMDSALPFIPWIDTAFRLCRAHWLAALSLDRVPPTEGASVVRVGLSRDLDRDALQIGGSSSPPIEGTGNG